MKIYLSKNKVLNSDGYSFWISEEKDTNKGITSKRISGYHGTLKEVFESYVESNIIGSDAKTIKELVEEIENLKEEIRTWENLVGIHDIREWKKNYEK